MSLDFWQGLPELPGNECIDCKEGKHGDCDGQEYTDINDELMVSICCCGKIIEKGIKSDKGIIIGPTGSMYISQNFERWAQQAANRMLGDNPEYEVEECPTCKELLFAPLGYDALKRGCFICGWNQN